MFDVVGQEESGWWRWGALPSAVNLILSADKRPVLRPPQWSPFVLTILQILLILNV